VKKLYILYKNKHDILLSEQLPFGLFLFLVKNNQLRNKLSQYPYYNFLNIGLKFYNQLSIMIFLAKS